MTGNWNVSDQDITTALERKAPVHVPADFAARVAAKAVTLPRAQARAVVSYSRLSAVVCAAVLLLVMFVLAAQAQASFTSVAFDLELLLLAQLIGIAWWMVAQKAKRAA